MSQKSLLYVPNESHEGGQVAARDVFTSCLEQGELESYQSYSLRVEVERVGSRIAAERLIDLAKESSPSVILIQHLAHTGFRKSAWAQLRQACPNSLIIYHEHDPYVPVRQPLPPEARAAAKFADVVYTSGTSAFKSNFRRAGAKQVRYSPQGYDSGRFGPEMDPPTRKPSVVMIANAHHPRKPWRLMPGASDRKRLVAESTRHFGSRFSVVGHGWTGSNAIGPCSYDEQSRILNAHTVSINWDHFPAESHYFSDRWPISLASNSVHITSRHPGQTDLTGAQDYLLSAQSVEGLIDEVDRVLGLPRDQVKEMATLANRFVKTRFEQRDEYRRLLYEAGLLVAPPPASSWLYETGLA